MGHKRLAGEPCRRGHPWAAGNVLFNGRTHACRECARITAKLWKRQKRAQNRRERKLPPMGVPQPCPKGHGPEHRRPGRSDCAICHRQAAVARARANGVPPHKPAMSEDEYRLARRAWEAKRRAAKLKRFVEHVDPAIVYARADGRCGICSEPVARDAFEVDHIIPLSRGGEHSYANTQAAHRHCNRKKWASLPEEMAAII